MDFEALREQNVPKQKIEQLKKAGIKTMEDLMYFFPRKYIDRSSYTGIQPEGESVFLFQCESVHIHNSRMMLVEAIGTLAGTNLQIRILWFNQAFMYSTVDATKGKLVLVAGIAKYMPAEPMYNKPDRVEVAAPAVYDSAGADALKIYPSYKKIPNMAEEYLIKLIRMSCNMMGEIPETVPSDILQRHSLMSHDEMIRTLHDPANTSALEQALRRQRWDDLLYFALRMEMNSRKTPKGSAYTLHSLGAMNKVRDSLPFQLTDDQANTLAGTIDLVLAGKRLNALIQGDVSCGKTIIALLLMIAFATNGYQAALMAPTKILARQHYEKLCQLCDPLNIPVVFVGGTLRQKEQKQLEERLANGEYPLVVGTQALLEEKYKFKNLALVVEDEEHKYGVMQRAALTAKAANGTHTVTMSATPIPRSLAQTIYGDSVQLFTITQKPAGRKPVMTGIATTPQKAISFLKRTCGQLKQQAYVVCPMIAANEKVEGVDSAEETFKLYEASLKDAGISVALVTGKTHATVANELIKSFEEGTISVLVSTTLIEVGVDVPNASCIIIHNAERFGLAQLHQLRGRVGRGNAESFCCLISPDPSNERLQAMVHSNDGFVIAQKDLEQRGAGDFLGVQQSGTEKFLMLALQYPHEYQQAQAAAKNILDSSERCSLLEQAMEDEEQQVGGKIL